MYVDPVSPSGAVSEAVEVSTELVESDHTAAPEHEATTSTVIVTPHGFIPDTPEAIKEYKKQYAQEWFNEQVDVSDLVQLEDNSEWEESSKISPIVEIDNDASEE